jgi:hypothetical protein
MIVTGVATNSCVMLMVGDLYVRVPRIVSQL